MQPNHLAIMEAEYNRNARRQDAEQHRLRVEAGIEAERDRAAGRIVAAAVGGINRIVSLVAGAKLQGDVRSTDTMSAITPSI